MDRNISNEKEFEENLNKLGDLYEEGKICLNCIHGAVSVSVFPEDKDRHDRPYKILQEMRDLAAVQMQHKHWIGEN